MYKKPVLLLIFLLFLPACFLWSQDRPDTRQNDLSLVKAACRELLLSDTVYATELSFQLTYDIIYDKDAAGYFASLTAEGSWPDLDYTSTQPGRWMPSWHMYRLLLLYRAYARHHDPAYLEAVHKGLAYWIQHNFICPNWWHNQINVPFAYSSLMIMLDKEVRPAEKAFLDTAIVKRTAAQRAPTGQNKIWKHDIEARIALYYNDEKAFSKAMTDMQSVITISTAEGIQPDYSFHQHGPMLQFGNYGMHFINSLLFWLKITGKSGFGFSETNRKMIGNYCSEGLRWTVFKGAMDITAIGRQLRDHCAENRGKTMNADFGLLQSLYPTSSCAYAVDGFYTKAQQACTLTGNKSFWRSNYMLQRSAQGMISVKTHGPFVQKVESINGENRKGAFLNDGVCLVQCTGKEYSNIEPLWNWTMLPGTTCDTTVNPADTKIFESKNTALFTGEVSNGKAGISAMEYDRLGIKAHKAYFLVNGITVALGAGITSPNPAATITTIDQCYYSNRKPVTGTSKKSNGLNWIVQGKTAYFFPAYSHLKTSIAARQGDWAAIDKASGNLEVKGTVFSIFISQARQDNYIYMIRPGATAQQAAAMASNPPVRILSNTTAVQAIQWKNTIMAVFYRAGELLLANKETIGVNRPCIMIYSTNTGAKEIWITDPSRQEETITVQVAAKQIRVPLPKDIYAGSAAYRLFN